MADPYLSHPVRRMRDDPIEGETAELIVEVADADDGDPADATGDGRPAVDNVAAAVESVDGAEVRERLRFGSLRVAVPEAGVASICALDGISSIETAATRSLGAGDAGEDVDPG